MWDLYIAKTRAEEKTKDITGYNIINDLFGKYNTTVMNLDSSLSKDFSMTRDENKPYTYKSQYLTKVRYSGNNAIKLTGNEKDNYFIIDVDNEKGITIDGSSGVNYVQYNANENEVAYNDMKVTRKNGIVDKFENISYIIFKDTTKHIK